MSAGPLVTSGGVTAVDRHARCRYQSTPRLFYLSFVVFQVLWEFFSFSIGQSGPVSRLCQTGFNDILSGISASLVNPWPLRHLVASSASYDFRKLARPFGSSPEQIADCLLSTCSQMTLWGSTLSPPLRPYAYGRCYCPLAR